ncbi:hypothetical protein FGIG_01029 [Fasciola gigantica]|uniref:GOLD domain-containing protein n=1 Tax=Fasciola gigantica TaxID=46835 RepID=A0A504YPF8_FASGI|nr:hypothetical protein FGIG_01029 [Fasciola gigantica]
MPTQAEGMSNQVPADQSVSPGMLSANQIHPSQVNDNFANQPLPPNVNVQNIPSDHVVVQPPNSHPGGGQPQAPVSFEGHPNQLPAAHTPAHIPRPVESVPHPGHLPVHQSVGGNGPVHEGVPVAPVPQQFAFHPDPSIPQFQGVPHHGEAPDVYNQFRHTHETNEPPRSRPHDENPPDEFVSMAIIVPSGSKNCYFYTPILDFIVYHQVIRGGGMDIGLRVVDPEGRNVISQRPSEDGKFSITVPSHFRMRPYAICFDNRKATFGEKYVSVMVDVDVNWDNPSEEDKKALDILRKRSFAGAHIPEMKREYIESWRTIDERVEGLYGRLHRIKLLQQRSNNFAAADKALMESNLSRVSSRSIVQVILMFGVATFQVILIRAFFDPNSRFYRIWFGKRSVAGARC